MCFGGGKADNSAADAARSDEARRKADIAQGISNINEKFAGFNDDFYGKREADFSAYAQPQLDLQHQKARKDLIFALSDAGTTRSSVAAEKMGELEREYGLQKLNVADQARGYATQARTDVENARNNLVNQVAATADSSAASTGALGQAQALVNAPTFSPLGQVFQNGAAGVGAYAKSAGAAPAPEAAPSGVRLYNGTGGSGRVVK